MSVAGGSSKALTRAIANDTFGDAQRPLLDPSGLSLRRVDENGFERE